MCYFIIYQVVLVLTTWHCQYQTKGASTNDLYLNFLASINTPWVLPLVDR